MLLYATAMKHSPNCSVPDRPRGVTVNVYRHQASREDTFLKVHFASITTTRATMRTVNDVSTQLVGRHGNVFGDWKKCLSLGIELVGVLWSGGGEGRLSWIELVC